MQTRIKHPALTVPGVPETAQSLGASVTADPETTPSVRRVAGLFGREG